MFKKRTKAVLAVCLAAALTFTSFPVTPLNVRAAEAAETVTNLALNKPVTASAEYGTMPATKAVDGIVNTERNDRWSTEAAPEQWLQVDLRSKAEISGFRVVAENDEAQRVGKFKIEGSNDNQTFAEIYQSEDKSAEGFAQDTTVTLDESVQYRFVKITIQKLKTGAYNSVSLREFEVHGIAGEEIPVEETFEQKVDKLAAPTVNEDGTALVFPELDGAVLEFKADYEQVVAADGTIRKPLTDKTIVGVYRATKDEETVESFTEHEVVIPGTHEDAGANAKPAVIPELAEWYGGAEEGAFSVTADTKVVYDGAAFKTAAEAFAADFEAETGIKLTVEAGKTAAGVICFSAIEDEMLGEEGYIFESGDRIDVKANDAKGAYWATRSLLQILKLNDNTVPFGEACDYPKYEVRSFSIDVARKPISMSTLEDMAKYMAYYKMNDFQIHLNDNLIFYEDFESVEEAMEKAYTGFRLESDIKAGQVVEGDSKGVANAEDLTNEDLFYTKEEFRQFILDSRAMGVGIVPEFDAPGHSGAFMDVRPDLHLKATIEGNAKRAGEQFDLSDEHYADSLNFVEKLWDEYLNEDMFDSSMIVHVGTDEYYGEAEGFRKFSRDIINHVQEKNPVVRMWGSLSHKKGTTEVPSENVQMNMWYNPYANPMDMYRAGYGLINTQDGSLYIVPAAGYYGDYLNSNYLYTAWQPNDIGGVKIPAGSDQMLGATFAIWNDSIDTRANGMSEVDIYDRFADAVPAFSSKTWGDGKDITHAEMREAAAELSDAPGMNPYSKAEAADGVYMNYEFNKDNEMKDSSANERNLRDQENVTFKKEKVQLNGGTSYVTTPIEKLATKNTLEFDLTLSEELKPGAILFEADTEGNEDYSHDIRIMEDGTLGFTRELYDYSFGYKLPLNKKVHLSIATDGTSTVLTVDGETYPATGKYVDAEGRVKKEGISNATLLLPLQRIGSKTNAAAGCTIDNIIVREGAASDPSIIDASKFTVTSDNENPQAGNEGPVSFAFDGNKATIWHSNYSPYQPLPASVEIDMNAVYEVNKFSYLPRQSGANGHITKYSLYYKEDAADEWKAITEEAEWAADNSLKTAEFDAVNARYIKLTALDGTGTATEKFAAAAEINVHKVVEAPVLTVDKDALESVVEAVEALKEADYTVDTWKAFAEALENAKTVFADKEATQEEVDAAAAALYNAKKALAAAEEPAPVNPFEDVKDNHTWYQAVLWAYENGIVAGADSTHFAPKDVATRGQMVAILWNQNGRPNPKNANPFTDVGKNSYYKNAISWAYENGIVKGVNDEQTLFDPDRAITRAEFVAILYRMNGEPNPTVENPFTDIKTSRYYYKAVLWAFENGITQGADKTHFAPDEQCTRGNLVHFLYNAKDIAPSNPNPGDNDAEFTPQ